MKPDFVYGSCNSDLIVWHKRANGDIVKIYGDDEARADMLEEERETEQAAAM